MLDHYFLRVEQQHQLALEHHAIIKGGGMLDIRMFGWKIKIMSAGDNAKLKISALTGVKPPIVEPGTHA